MNREKARELLSLPFEELIGKANRIRQEHIGSNIELCGIVNAKSGACSEDCKFCAQSAHHSTNIESYPLINKEDIVAAAKKAASNGSRNFGIVTSGNRLNEQEIEDLALVLWIEVSGGFVGQKQGCPGDQCAADGYALTLSLRELRNPAPRLVAETQLVAESFRALSYFT